MHIKIKSERDFWSGIAFLLTGLGFGWGAMSYAFGDSARPGPAYFPFGLGIMLAILGAFIVFEALTIDTEDGEKIGAWAWKPLAWTLVAVLFFGWALPLLGMLIALPLLVLITARAGDEFHWGEALLNAAILTVGSWAIFVWALKLTLPLWPSFIAH